MKLDRLLKIAVLTVIGLPVAGACVLATLIIQQQFFYRIPLPNGYLLAQFFGGACHLDDNHGHRLFGSHVITQFSVSSPCVYGWLEHAPESHYGWLESGDGDSYFFVDTATGDTRTFHARPELDRFLDSRHLPLLKMQTSYTIFDFQYGRLSKNW